MAKQDEISVRAVPVSVSLSLKEGLEEREAEENGKTRRRRFKRPSKEGKVLPRKMS